MTAESRFEDASPVLEVLTHLCAGQFRIARFQRLDDPLVLAGDLRIVPQRVADKAAAHVAQQLQRLHKS